MTIPAGETDITFEVSTADDAVEEDDSTVTAAIVSGAGYTVGTPGSAPSSPVHDNDAPPTVSIRRDLRIDRGPSGPVHRQPRRIGGLRP